MERTRPTSPSRAIGRALVATALVAIIVSCLSSTLCALIVGSVTSVVVLVDMRLHDDHRRAPDPLVASGEVFAIDLRERSAGRAPDTVTRGSSR